MKKCIIFLVLSFIINSVIFGQQRQIQKLTFTELMLNGTSREVTVYAVLMGWIQNRWTLEDGLQVCYQTYKYIDSDDWTPWELDSKEPSLFSTIRQNFDVYLQFCVNYPNGGMIVTLDDGMKTVKKISTPPNRISPVWWNSDGKSFFVFFEYWAIFFEE